MKRFIARYMLYIYLRFIKEDWDDWKDWVVPFIKPAWFVRSILVWISSIVLFPIFYVGMIIEEKTKDINMEDIMRIMMKTK